MLHNSKGYPYISSQRLGPSASTGTGFQGVHDYMELGPQSPCSVLKGGCDAAPAPS